MVDQTKKIQLAMLGPLGPAQLACFRSWREAGIRTHFIDTEERPLPGLLRGIVDHYHHVGALRGLDAKALQQVLQVLKEAGSQYLCCLGERLAVRLWQERESFAGLAQVLTIPAELMMRLESKVEQAELGRRAGFDVLPTLLIDADNAERSGPALKFPQVIRPDRASLDPAFKAEFIEDASALLRFVLARPVSAPRVVAQPFVNGPNVVVHGSRSEHGEVGRMHAFIGRLKHGGVTVSLEPFELPTEVETACCRFVNELELCGVFHFDLMLDPETGRIWFLEVNARFGGTTAKVLAAGYDEPRAMLQAFGLLAVDVNERPLDALRPVVNRMAALKCLLAGIRGKGSRIDYPFPNRTQQVWASLRAICGYRDEVLTLRDLRSALAFLSQYRP